MPPVIPIWKRFRTKLTFLFSTLFGLILCLIAIGAYQALVNQATRNITNDLTANAQVYARIWNLREDQLWENTSLLAKDFGFRAAVADGDGPTIASALDNLKARLGSDAALLLTPDGATVTPHGGAIADGLAARIQEELTTNKDARGLVVSGDSVFQAVALPVSAPDLLGWAIFGTQIDEEELAELQNLSALALDIAILSKTGQGGWSVVAHRGDAKARDIELAVGPALSEEGPRSLRLGGRVYVMLSRELRSHSPQLESRIVLSYPVFAAMKDYEALLALTSLIALVGMAALFGGCWMLARSVTKPVAMLTQASQKMSMGEMTKVNVAGGDEFTQLADSFNEMVDQIAAREKKITHLATHDAETGMPNRLWLERHMDQSRKNPNVSIDDKRHCCFVIGINRFVALRNTIGHKLIAQLHQEIGSRITEKLGETQVAILSHSMIGFALCADAEQRRDLASTLLTWFAKPIVLGGQTVDVHVTIGAALALDTEAVVQNPIDRASIAVEQARGLRQPYMEFDADLYGDPGSNLSMMGDLRAAMGAERVTLAFQPKYCLRSQCVTGVEALVRWIDETRGFVRPDIFIEMAEETGLIRDVTEYVLERALAGQKHLHDNGHTVSLSVNISGMLIDDEAFIESAIAATQGAPGPVMFEITETAVIDNPETALKMIHKLRDTGIKVSIDDYGTGMSSLAYLKRIPAQELKIDKAFVLKLASEKLDGLLVKSTIDLAHSLGMQVAAEGIEDEISLQLLRGYGCDLAQGFFIAKPMALADLQAFLDTSVWNGHQPDLNTTDPQTHSQPVAL